MAAGIAIDGIVFIIRIAQPWTVPRKTSYCPAVSQRARAVKVR
jgi:hypothetical protein